MKRFIILRFAAFLVWLLNWVFKTKLRPLLESCITELYREIARDNLFVDSRVINVKKGKGRYRLMFFERPDGTLRFNLNRHEWRHAGTIVNRVHELYGKRIEDHVRIH